MLMNRSKRKIGAVIVAFMLLFTAVTGLQQSLAQGARVLYVRSAAAGADDGTSWEDAYTDLQDALEAAQSGDEIWVARGVYYPAPEPGEGESPDRSATFQLVSGVAIYGGFQGNETDRNGRDWKANPTVLSADLDRNDQTDADGVVTASNHIYGDNAYHVVTASGSGQVWYQLDGLIITGGDADVRNGDSWDNHGGGLYVIGGSDPHTGNALEIRNTRFVGNRARSHGGGLYVRYHRMNVVLTDVEFFNNAAGTGGGLYYDKTSGDTRDVILERVRFEGNQATVSGGGARLAQTSGDRIRLTDVTFTDNEAEEQYGGGLSSRTNETPIELHRVVFDGNVAPYGGGMHHSDGSATMQGVEFRNNTADGTSASRGGGLLVNVRFGLDSADLELVNTVFRGNSARQGGGLSVEGTDDDSLTMVNGLFHGNEAFEITQSNEGMGGAIYNNLDHLSLINTTLSGNRTRGTIFTMNQGGAIYNANTGTATRPTLINCVLWGNVSDGSDQIHNLHADGKPDIAYSLIQGSGASGTDWAGVLGIDGGNNLDTDPLFEDPVGADQAPTTAGNYRLQPGSPAVDAGTDTPFAPGGAASSVAVDLDGNSRIIGSAVDMGAYELMDDGVDTGTLTVTILPESVRAEGARWRPVGAAVWYESGTTLALDPGVTVVEFNSLDGWNAPPDREVTIVKGGAVSIEGDYRPAVLFVKANATGLEDGTSWTDAYTDVQDALNDARAGMEIWVAAGVYLPTHRLDPEDPRTATFLLTDGVAVYGGFDGSEVSRHARDWRANATVLSGDLDGNDETGPDGAVTNPDGIAGDNAYTVVTGIDVGGQTILDGLTVTAGKADGASEDPLEQRFGGAICLTDSSPTLRHLVLTGSVGGGMYNRESHPVLEDVIISWNHGTGMRNEYSHPVLTRVDIEHNRGDEFGGGMHNSYSHPTLRQVNFTANGHFASQLPGYGGGMNNSNSDPLLIGVTFRGNYSRAEGGGMCNFSNSHPTLINVLFSGNATGQRGGGLYNSSSSPTLVNVTFSNNYAWAYGGGLFNRNNSHPVLINSIIWHHMAAVNPGTNEIYNDNAVPVFRNSIIKGSGGSNGWNEDFGADSGGNLDLDPQFVDGRTSFSTAGSVAGDYRLTGDSPAIGAGINSPYEAGGIAHGVVTDLDGHPRLVGEFMDMGPYEFQTEPAGLATVGTAGELAAAVADPFVRTIRFADSITADIDAKRLINVDLGTHTLTGNVWMETAEAGLAGFDGSANPAISGNLIVEAANATVVNDVAVGGTVIIHDIAGNTWDERADGNDLLIDMIQNGKTIVIRGTVRTLTVLRSGDDLNIIIEGGVETAVFEAPVTVTGADRIDGAYLASEGVILDNEPQQYVHRLSMAADPVQGGTLEGAGYYPEGEQVTIRATAAPGYRFGKWTVSSQTGSLSDQAETLLTMPGADAHLTAAFLPVRSGSTGGMAPDPVQRTLTVRVDGDGSVTPEPGAHQMRDGQVVELRASAAEGWTFLGWRGDLDETEAVSITVTMDQDRQITAVFGQDTADEPDPEVWIRMHIGSLDVTVNNERTQMDTSPFLNRQTGRTMVPVRRISEWMGAEVTWHQQTRQVIIRRQDDRIQLTVGSPYGTVNGRLVALDSPVMIREGRTFVPLRFVGEMLGAAVHWKESDQEITIVR